jgi:hypothetical protein
MVKLTVTFVPGTSDPFGSIIVGDTEYAATNEPEMRIRQATTSPTLRKPCITQEKDSIHILFTDLKFLKEEKSIPQSRTFAMGTPSLPQRGWLPKGIPLNHQRFSSNLVESIKMLGDDRLQKWWMKLLSRRATKRSFQITRLKKEKRD